MYKVKFVNNEHCNKLYQKFKAFVRKRNRTLTII